MSELGDSFRAHRAHVRELKAKHGIDCPTCQRIQPKRIPTRLLPQQRCKVCGYRDPRSRIDEEST